MHGINALKLNTDTRLRSILSMGGSSSMDVSVVVSVENSGGHPARNGVNGEEVKEWEPWERWVCSALLREPACPDSKAEAVCC